MLQHDRLCQLTKSLRYAYQPRRNILAVCTCEIWFIFECIVFVQGAQIFLFQARHSQAVLRQKSRMLVLRLYSAS